MSESDLSPENPYQNESLKFINKVNALIDVVQSGAIEIPKTPTLSDRFPERRSLYISDNKLIDQRTGQEVRKTFIKDLKVERTDDDSLKEVRDVSIFTGEPDVRDTSDRSGPISSAFGLEGIKASMQTAHSVFADETGKPIRSEHHETIFLFGSDQVYKIETTDEPKEGEKIVRGWFPTRMQKSEMTAEDYEFLGGTLANLEYDINSHKKTD